MEQLAVIGNPIAHSLSPRMFELFAEQSVLEIQYRKILATDVNDFNNKVQEFFAQGGLALNVTSPFKQAAYNLAPQSMTRAKFCQSSSFMYKNGDGTGFIADTFDGPSLVNDLVYSTKSDLSKLKILILGSGYVLDAVLLDFIVKNPVQIDLLARNTTRVNELCHKFGVGQYIPTQKYDLIINTVPNNVDNELLTALKPTDDIIVGYDLNYVKDSKFLKCMLKLNRRNRCRDGLGMLLAHNRMAFAKLFGCVPDTQPVYKQLKQCLND